MKIAMLTPTFYGYDGVARVVEQQAEEYVKKGDEVTIFALGGDIKPKDANIAVLGTPNSLFLRRIHWLFFPLDIFKIIKYVKRLKEYELIISHHYPMNWLAYVAKKFYKIKYVYQAHGLVLPELYPKFYERVYAKLFYAIWRKSISNADSVISVSHCLKERLKKELNIDSEVIHNKIDKTLFNEGVNGSIIRRRYRLDKDPIILYVGRIDPYKGIHLLIEAFKMVKKEMPNVKLLIIGKRNYDYYFKEVKQMADNSVLFVDYVPHEDLPYYYAACNIYATASLLENNPLPPMEAIACGKPVIAFDIEAHKEITNKNIVLVEKGNIENFAEACIKTLIKQKSIKTLV